MKPPLLPIAAEDVTDVQRHRSCFSGHSACGIKGAVAVFDLRKDFDAVWVSTHRLRRRHRRIDDLVTPSSGVGGPFGVDALLQSIP